MATNQFVKGLEGYATSVNEFATVAGSGLYDRELDFKSIQLDCAKKLRDDTATEAEINAAVEILQEMVDSLAELHKNVGKEKRGLNATLQDAQARLASIRESAATPATAA